MKLNRIFVLALIVLLFTTWLAYGQEPVPLDLQRDRVRFQLVTVRAQLTYLEDRFNKELEGYVAERKRLRQQIQDFNRQVIRLNKQISELPQEPPDGN